MGALGKRLGRGDFVGNEFGGEDSVVDLVAFQSRGEPGRTPRLTGAPSDEEAAVDEVTATRAMAKKATAKKATGKKATVRKAAAKKATAKKAAAKEATTQATSHEAPPDTATPRQDDDFLEGSDGNDVVCRAGDPTTARRPCPTSAFSRRWRAASVSTEWLVNASM
jgi:hypothetical protein